MKQQCDQHCETCPMQTQVHCAVVHARAAYITAATINERLAGIEQALQKDNHPLINPLAMPYAPIIDDEEEKRETPCAGSGSLNK